MLTVRSITPLVSFVSGKINLFYNTYFVCYFMHFVFRRYMCTYFSALILMPG